MFLYKPVLGFHVVLCRVMLREKRRLREALHIHRWREELSTSPFCVRTDPRVLEPAYTTTSQAA